MPVTAKLSRKFYERFGDELTNELVEWFNLIDATYRTELRELNDLNYARFDAKLEQRVAELRAEMHAGFARLDAKVDQRIAELRADLRTELVAGLTALETRLTRRLFGFWIAQAATTVGLVFGVVQLLQL
jgi:hypothetical protein